MAINSNPLIPRESGWTPHLGLTTYCILVIILFQFLPNFLIMPAFFLSACTKIIRSHLKSLNDFIAKVNQVWKASGIGMVLTGFGWFHISFFRPKLSARRAGAYQSLARHSFFYCNFRGRNIVFGEHKTISVFFCLVVAWLLLGCCLVVAWLFPNFIRFVI